MKITGNNSFNEKKYLRLRITAVGILFSSCFLIIGAKAVYLQFFKGEWLSEKAAAQYERSFIVKGKRGTIYDANNQELAVSIEVTSVAANPLKLKYPRTMANELSKILKVSKKGLKDKLLSKKNFVWIKRHVTPVEKTTIKNLKVEGIMFLPEYKRFYPNKTLAAQFIGFSGMDGSGLEGLEYYYNSYLEGSNDKITVVKDALGRDLNLKGINASESNGNNIKLTINRKIQYIVKDALKKTAENYNAKSGISIVMSPETGAILALAHYPDFNPNSFKKFSKNDWRNRAITDPFEPGSTMKVFLAAAAIENGYSTPESLFYCENGSYKIGVNTINDTHPHEWITLQDIVKSSSNIGAVKISEKTGKGILYRTLKDFGFGSKTGIKCPGETSGILSHYSNWTNIDVSTIAFGQGISVSAIQLITAICAIANDGDLMRPYLVDVIKDDNGIILHSFTPQKIRKVISSSTARKIRDIMATVVTKGGTGVNAALKGYEVCGKTGTAQKIEDDGTYSNEKYIASFVGFASKENPKVAVLVVINEPQKIYYGSQVAAPAFKKIIHATLNQMKVLPENKMTELVAEANRRKK